MTHPAPIATCHYLPQGGARRTFPVVGREWELAQLIAVLSKCFKPKAMLIGEPGAGKTALVEGLAQRHF